MSKYSNKIREFRKRAGINQTQLADAAGYSDHAVISRIERGETGVTIDKLIDIAEALNVSPSELIGESSSRTTPVVGYVGAGAEVYPIDDHPKGFGFDTVESPPGDNRKFVAVIVEGESMYPLYQSGDVLFYTRDGFSELDRCWGKACVVQITDGPMLVKTLQRGSETNMFNLISFNAPPKENIALDWAARVAWVKPK